MVIPAGAQAAQPLLVCILLDIAGIREALESSEHYSHRGEILYSRPKGTTYQEAIAAPAEAPPPPESAPRPEQSVPFALDPFLVNLADPSGKRYLRATFEFEVNPLQGVEEMKAITSQVRDRIILVLTSKHFDDMRTTTGKGALREEILNELNQILTSGKARHIYFKEFVVQ
jgi:flagellar protein FliL